jgi:hypothetical protein
VAGGGPEITIGVRGNVPEEFSFEDVVVEDFAVELVDGGATAFAPEANGVSGAEALSTGFGAVFAPEPEATECFE